MMLHLVTPPAAAPLHLDETKAHLRVDHDDDDDPIEGLIAAATQHLDGPEGILGRALMTQTWRLQARRPACRDVLLALPPVTAITRVAGLVDGELVDLAAASYRLGHGAGGAYATLADAAAWPGTDSREDALQITFTTGVATAAEVPAPIRQAMLLMIGHWYANREVVNVGNIVTQFPASVQALLAPYRRIRV